MLCSQSDTNLATIPWTASSVKKYFPDSNLLTKKNGLKSLHLSAGRDRNQTAGKFMRFYWNTIITRTDAKTSFYQSCKKIKEEVII